VILLVCCLLGAVGGAVSGALGLLPAWAAVPLVAASLYLSFTPMHDSAHRSVSRRRWVNSVVGWVCGFLMCAPFVAFRYAHLRHHHHTNEEGRDPDQWSGQGPWWQLPLRWMTQDLHYYGVYLAVWDKRPVRERLEAALTLGLVLATLLGLVALGYGVEVVLFWLLPTRLAVMALAFLFDYVPHRPHQVPARQDAYKATRNLGRLWLTPVLLYQNYHLSHHLYPGVPFYRYKKAWFARHRSLNPDRG
jgi:fatty acid desaturase